MSPQIDLSVLTADMERISILSADLERTSVLPADLEQMSVLSADLKRISVYFVNWAPGNQASDQQHGFKELEVACTCRGATEPPL
jgi:hypothetical protein